MENDLLIDHLEGNLQSFVQPEVRSQYIRLPSESEQVRHSVMMPSEKPAQSVCLQPLNQNFAVWHHSQR
jgi:hypothetical protein